MKITILLACVSVLISVVTGRPSVRTMGIGEQNPDLFEGDILMPRQSGRSGLKNETLLWPNGRVPYKISHNFNRKQGKVILEAMRRFHKETCIRFVPKLASDYDYVDIVTHTKECSSYVGKVTRRNFEKVAERWSTVSGTEYDYDSIMHYSKWAFSVKRNVPGYETIIPKKDGVVIGQRMGFSETDIYEINTLYNCGKPKPPSTTSPTTPPSPTTTRPSTVNSNVTCGRIRTADTGKTGVSYPRDSIVGDRLASDLRLKVGTIATVLCVRRDERGVATISKQDVVREQGTDVYHSSVTLTCQSDGSWSNMAPFVCVPGCTDIGNVNEEYRKYPHMWTSDYNHGYRLSAPGGEVTISCPSGPHGYICTADERGTRWEQNWHFNPQRC